jgi:1-acylglycerone phosphate reductase
MAPFQVKVVPIMTGFVHTNIFNQGHGIELPKESLYWPAHKQINARSAGTDVTEKMDADVYANGVVNDLTKGADGRIYRGGMSSGAKFITTFLPTSMVVSELQHARQLNEYLLLNRTR